MYNMAKTAALLGLLCGLCVTVGGLIGHESGILIGGVVAFTIAGGSYWFSDKVAIRSARAQEVSAADMPQYHEIMRELCGRANLPMPKLYISPNMQPNAFATGRNPQNSAVCVTRGLLRVMDWREIRGVLAHELCHIRNRDILICSVASAIGTAVTLGVQIAMYMTVFTGRDDRDGGGFIVTQLLALLLAPIAASLIQFAVSRSREYQADASAAKLMGDGKPLADALERLESYSKRIASDVNPSQAPAYIVNPLKSQAAGRQRSNRHGSGHTVARYASMFSTHPPTSERIRRLRSADWST